MRRTPNRPARRAGFTLVELLVVITIIAILFALTSAAVVKALGKMDEVRTRNDISQLAERDAVRSRQTSRSPTCPTGWCCRRLRPDRRVATVHLVALAADHSGKLE